MYEQKVLKKGWFFLRCDINTYLNTKMSPSCFFRCRKSKSAIRLSNVVKSFNLSPGDFSPVWMETFLPDKSNVLDFLHFALLFLVIFVRRRDWLRQLGRNAARL